MNELDQPNTRKGAGSSASSRVVQSLADLLKSAFKPRKDEERVANIFNVELFTPTPEINTIFLSGDCDFESSVIEGSLELAAGQKISTGVFRNSLFLEPWRLYTGLKGIEVNIEFAGRIKFNIWKAPAGGKVELLKNDNFSQAEFGTKSISLGTMEFLGKNTRLFWDIEAIEPSTIRNVSFASKEPVKPANIVVTLRTFGRTTDVVALLGRLHAQVRTSAHARMLQHLVFVFLDTSDSVEAIHANWKLPESLNLLAYSGANLGGGGNAAQVLLDVRAAVELADVKVDDVLIMDDDLDVSLESLYRHWAFVSHRTTPVISTLPVLMKSEPRCVWEDGGIWGRFSPKHGSPDRLDPFPRLVRHGWRLQHFDYLDEFARANHPEYATFIFYSIPWDFFLKLGLPAAFFLRGDDIEYSLRAKSRGYKLISNPNLAAWHEPAHSYAQEYMAVLHGLIINMTYGVAKPSVFVEFFMDRYRGHAGLLDASGLTVYLWVLESLIGKRTVLDANFVGHYKEMLRSAKALDKDFEIVDPPAINLTLASKDAGRENIRAHYIYPEARTGERLGRVILDNHQTGTVRIYDATDPDVQMSTAKVSRSFFAALEIFIASFDEIVAHWRDRLRESASPEFWATVRADQPDQLKLLYSGVGKPVQITAPTAPKSTQYSAKNSIAGLLGRRTVGTGQSEFEIRKNELPPDFDRAGYLKHNPDVSEAGLDPAAHYVNYGRREGRTWR